jgi:cold shock CspA family protein
LNDDGTRGGDATAAAWRMARRTVHRDDGTRTPKVTGKIRTKEYFFHQSAIYGEGLENLREGDSVEFDIGEGPKGPRAENVRRTST